MNQRRVDDLPQRSESSTMRRALRARQAIVETLDRHFLYPRHRPRVVSDQQPALSLSLKTLGRSIR